MRHEPEPGEWYQDDLLNNVFEVIHLAVAVDTGKRLVVYRPRGGETWFRLGAGARPAADAGATARVAPLVEATRRMTTLALVAALPTVVAAVLGNKAATVVVRDNLDKFMEDIARQGRWSSWAAIANAVAAAVLIVQTIIG